ncbi:SDR family oxidoreductase [Geminicoccus harenae]|uniref:SDR family oxidoreductase n=1 Tax=Geminicoccus harenae TaxID=2498453 RepID=UPI00168AFE0B|nr:SDR family oxidoreductase [Geminicoccus harenae]
MILVTGATGANGRQVVDLLAKANARVRAMVRSPAKAGDLARCDGVELVGGDFDDPASLRDALDGVERALLLTPSTAKAEERQLRFVEMAQAAGVRQIVKFSQFAADRDSPVRFLRYHAAVEEAIRASGMAWTFLRPNLFMQGLLAFAGSIAEQGRFFAAAGSARVSVVDVRDNAAVAVAALTDDGHAGRIYTLTGPEALSHAEMASRIAAATGRPVAFVDVSPQEMRAALDQLGMDPWQADGLIEDYAHYRRGEASEVTQDVEDVTGRRPRSFDDFARDHAEAFSSEGSSAPEA